MGLWSRVALLLVFAVVVFGVDRNNFKNCNESGFCKRQREVKSENAHYVVDPATVSVSGDTASMELVDTAAEGIRLVLKVSGLAKNTARVHITEKSPIHPRYEVKDVLPEKLEGRTLTQKEKSEDSIVLEFEGGNTVAVSFKPFRVDVVKDNVVVMSINGKGLFHFEHYRNKQEGDNPNMWEETYKSHKDTKPKGPSSVGIDISFPNFEHVYGIPEHATSLALKPTTDSDPYRLYNLDVFEYELDNPMALYGSIPYMLAHNEKQTAGVLFLNSAEMWIDVDATKASTGLFNHLSSWFSTKEDKETSYVDTHWMAESGVIDLFVFTGPSPKDVFNQYSSLTGYSPLPPLFSVAYHQCRWNYNDEDDVAFVAKNMDEHDIPMDVVWLDIEHTDGKRYMTWDSGKFPHPEVMQNNLAIAGRKMVNIVDPHIKRVGGYHVHEEAQKLGHYIKNKDGNEYDGHCWPGSSSWLDYMNPAIRSWWADQFAFNKYQGTTKHMYYWNDMNEPSVFNGPEVTMHKDAQHYGGWEHRDVHNIYGMWQQAATAEGIIKRSGGVERPFVLSRAFFAGSQRYGAIWTGDNLADWGHLKASVPMILSIGLAGLPFAGADIGGFFKNPEPELLVRWYQVGAYQPFMRAHAHLDTKRREPYLYEGSEKEIIRNAIRTRYELLPFFYTVFWETSVTGSPVIRPLWVEFPEDTQIFAEEDSFLVGSDLLVTPATAAGVTAVSVYFPGSEPWYDVETYQAHTGPARKQISAPLRKIPVFQRGGSIIPRKLRIRRSSELMRNDPFTLVAALNSEGSATGKLYADDYHTFDYKKGLFSVRDFSIKKTGNGYEFKSTGGSNKHETKEWIERIVVAGFPSAPSSIKGNSGEALGFSYDSQKQALTIKKPATSITADFTVVITL